MSADAPLVSVPEVPETSVYRETPLYLESGSETIFAMYTRPAGEPSDLGVVFAHSGETNFTAHRNAVFARMSRALARAGFPSVRFDYAGTGESSGEIRKSVGGHTAQDADAAIHALTTAGCRRLLLVGSCYGAIPLVVVGAGRDDVAGALLLSPYLVAGEEVAGSLRGKAHQLINLRTLRTLATNADYRRWFFRRLGAMVRALVEAKLDRSGSRPPGGAPEAAAKVVPPRGLLIERDLAQLVTRGVPVQVVFGAKDDGLRDAETDPEAARALRLLRENRVSPLGWTVVDGPVHGMEEVATQETMIQLVLQRAHELASAL